MKDKEGENRNRRKEFLDCHPGMAPVRGEGNSRIGQGGPQTPVQSCDSVTKLKVVPKQRQKTHIRHPWPALRVLLCAVMTGAAREAGPQHVYLSALGVQSWRLLVLSVVITTLSLCHAAVSHFESLSMCYFLPKFSQQLGVKFVKASRLGLIQSKGCKLTHLDPIRSPKCSE